MDIIRFEKSEKSLKFGRIGIILEHGKNCPQKYKIVLFPTIPYQI